MKRTSEWWPLFRNKIPIKSGDDQEWVSETEKGRLMMVSRWLFPSFWSCPDAADHRLRIVLHCACRASRHIPFSRIFLRPTLRGIPFREAFMIKPYRCGHVQSYAHCNAQQNTHQLSRWLLWYGDGLVDSEGCKAPATMNVANPESLVTDDVKITIKFCGGNLSESSSSHQNGKIQMKIVCSSTAGPLGKENIMEKQKKKK